MVHNRGEVEYLNGNFYVGELLHGKRNGIGSYYCVNSDRFTGEWKDGKRVSGTETFWCKESDWLSGEYYIGDYENDLFHGDGKFYMTSMEIYENLVEEMPLKFVSVHKAGETIPKFTSNVLPEALFLDPDDVVIDRMPYITHYYDGEWANGKPHGNGTFYWGYGEEHELDFNGKERWNGHWEGEWNNGVLLYIEGKYRDEFADYEMPMQPETIRMINSMFKEKTLLMRGNLSDE